MKKLLVVAILALGASVGVADEISDYISDLFISDCKKDKTGELCYEIGSNYMWSANNYNQARYFFKIACTKNKKYCNYEAEIDTEKGENYLSKKDYTQAEIWFKKACEKDKERCNYEIIIGRHLLRNKNYEQAEIWFKKACEEDKTGKVCLDIGLTYSVSVKDSAKEGDLKHREYAEKKSQFYYDIACEKDAENCFKIGVYYDYDDSDYEKAEIYYKKACEKDEKYCSQLSSTRDKISQLYFNKGNSYLRQKDYKQAEVWFKKACEKDKRYCEARIDFAKGENYFREKDYKEAENHFKKACEKNKWYCNYEAKIDLAKGRDYLEKDYEKAKDYFKKACEKDKKHCSSLAYESNEKGKAYFKNKDYAQAELWFKRACENKNSNTYFDYYDNPCEYEIRIYGAKGEDYLAKKNYKLAEFWLKKACEKNKYDHRVYCDYEAKIDFAKGQDYLKNKDITQAELYLNKACEKDKGYCDYEGYYKKGAEYFKNKNYKEAEIWFQKACPDDYVYSKGYIYMICSDIGDLYVEIENFKQARIYYDRVCHHGNRFVCMDYKDRGSYEESQIELRNKLKKMTTAQQTKFFKDLCGNVRSMMNPATGEFSYNYVGDDGEMEECIGNYFKDYAGNKEQAEFWYKRADEKNKLFYKDENDK